MSPKALVQSDILETVKSHYHLEGAFDKQFGYESLNYLLTTSNEGKFIVKIHQGANPELLAAENDLLAFLQTTSVRKFTPRPVATIQGDYITTIQKGGEFFQCRVLSWLEGKLLNEIESSVELLADVGGSFGSLNDELSRYSDVRLQGLSHSWDLQAALNSFADLENVSDPVVRRQVDYFYLQFEEKILPVYRSLERQLIHGDANDYNILVTENRLSGIIDFGDVAWSYRVNDLAILMTYSLMGKSDLVEWAKHLVVAFIKECELRREEIEILYFLIGARLAVSLTKSAAARKKKPDNRYLQISDQSARALLDQLIRTSPHGFTNKILEACGFRLADNKTNDLVDKRSRMLSSALSISYKAPIQMKSAAFQYMYSDDGRVYLDCVNNICHVGHCHPRVVRAGQKQMALLNTNTRYIYKTLTDYCQALISKLPAPLEVVVLVNSGSEAGDLAQRIARTVTGAIGTIVVEHGYHGNTLAGIEASPYKYGGKGGDTKADHIYQMSIPDGYRGKFTYDDPDSGSRFAEEVDDAITYFDQKGMSPAMFYCESIIGCGGQVVLPAGYLPSVYQKVRAAGALCICDEVQVGFGRVGSTFWGFQLQDVVPDIVVLGKPMGNGHPIAAVAMTREVARAFDNGMEYFSSFGGNPVSCAIGLEVLNIIETEDLQGNARETGRYFKEQLASMATLFPIIGDVRGEGLFLGIELVTDRQTKEPATSVASMVIDEMKKDDVLLSIDGPHSNVIKIKPSLTFSMANVDFVIDRLQRILKNAGT